MVTMLVHPRSQVVPPVGRATKKMMTTYKSFLNFHPWTKKARLFGDGFAPIHISKVGEQTPGLLGDNNYIKEDQGKIRTLEQTKADLFEAVQGIDRGIFGVTSAKKTEIHGIVELLESQNPTSNPTLSLEKVDGCWKLVYSTITILGSKRTKLGLRDFITLGDIFQNIDVAKVEHLLDLASLFINYLNSNVINSPTVEIRKWLVLNKSSISSVTNFQHLGDAKTEGKAVNVIKFNVRGLNLFNGQLTIEASFKTASKSRVDIKYESSNITPDQLLNMFRKNYEILLGIFNPEDWLEITYVDDDLRIGRNDKDHIFVLKRSDEA